jgi:hypothetical protein
MSISRHLRHRGMRATAVDGKATGRLFCVAQTVCIYYYDRAWTYLSVMYQDIQSLRHRGMRATGVDGKAIGRLFCVAQTVCIY